MLKARRQFPASSRASDVTTAPFKQLVIAVSEGAKASLGAFEYLIRESMPAPVERERVVKALA